MKELYRDDDAEEGSRLPIAGDRRLSDRQVGTYEDDKWSLKEEVPLVCATEDFGTL